MIAVLVRSVEILAVVIGLGAIARFITVIVITVIVQGIDYQRL